MGWFLFLFLGIFLAANVPVSISLGLASIAILILGKSVPLLVVVQRLFTATDSFPLMAVPFFMLAGALMEYGGISRRLVKFAQSFVGALSGGLALVAIMGSMFFAAISGSAAATTAAIGSIMIPEMVKRKYDIEYSSAVQAASGSIGVIIPPSIPLVVYGVLTGTSIGALFMGGFFPGILMGLSLMVTAYAIARYRGYKGEKKISVKNVILSFKDSILALLMPIIILGGIYGGIFTPTEAAVVAVVYAMVVGVFVYKEINWEIFKQVMVKSTISTAVVMFLIATASLFGWILTWEEIPQKVAEAITQFTNNPIAILIIINLVYLLVGTFLDTVAAILIFVPIFFPVVTAVGINPIQFGLITVVNLAVGMITPPFGICLFVACSIAKIKLEDIVKAIWPFFLALIIDILIVSYVPQVSTWLPSLMIGK